jgi:hypothetical protein
MSTAGPIIAGEPLGAAASCPFLGRWISTNPRTTALAEATFTGGPRGVTLRVLGVGKECGRIDWGPTPATLLVDDQGEEVPTKVKASYDFGFMDVSLHGWVKQGVLVLAVFSRFRDDDGRVGHFDREFFFKAAGPGPSEVDPRPEAGRHG